MTDFNIIKFSLADIKTAPASRSGLIYYSWLVGTDSLIVGLNAKKFGFGSFWHPT